MGDVIYVDFRNKRKTGTTHTIKDSGSIQEDNNDRVLDKMRKGDNLSTSTLKDSWYPSRGVFDRTLGRMVPGVKKDDSSNPNE